jgi:hypothetical protein
MYNLIRNINKSKKINKIIVQGQYGKKTGKCYSRIILHFSYNVFYSHLLARTSIQ